MLDLKKMRDKWCEECVRTECNSNNGFDEKCFPVLLQLCDTIALQDIAEAINNLDVKHIYKDMLPQEGAR